MMKIADVKKLLKKVEKAYLLTHQNPDADALGSSLALMTYLRNCGKIADVVLEEKLHNIYDYLEGEYILPEEATEKRTVIVLDCADENRLGNTHSIFKNAKETIVIDHHATNTGFGNKFLVMGNMSSTGEIIYNIIKKDKKYFTKKIAFLLYCSIMSDTGGLRYSCASAETLIAVSDIMKYGIDTAYACRMIFENNPMEKIRLKGKVTSTLKLVCDGKVGIIRLTEDMLENGMAEELSEGFVNIPRGIEGVEVGVFLKERDDEIKISLRSNTYADVSRVAKEFGGGGHIRASGCSYKGTIDEAEKAIIEEVSKVLQR